MAEILKKALTLITGEPPKTKRPLQSFTERDLIRLESEIGRELFGPVPAGHRREFFCLDEHTWIWHEEWIDTESGERKIMTTRYEVHPNGILKVQEGQPYRFIEGQELEYLATATRMYRERVMRELYKRDPQTGQLLTETPDTIDA
ncbi:hypothetical protein CYG49_03540 [Candidatus Saccharibacteria bacterium]|nr:MAG: hypothetical protein CYG49_03540 [Candidatus Saccharibacteria bacterium]